MSADDEGAMARLVNYDNGTTVDSVLVADGMALCLRHCRRWLS